MQAVGSCCLKWAKATAPTPRNAAPELFDNRAFPEHLRVIQEGLAAVGQKPHLRVALDR